MFWGLFFSRLVVQGSKKKREIVYVGELALTQQEYNNWRGKFGRACTPKQASGRLDVPEDVHETFLQKGKKKEQIFEQFIRANGDKEWVQKPCRCTGARMGSSICSDKLKPT